MSALGQTIKHRREQRGMSLQDVADEAGITKSHVWDLERGSARNPTIQTLLNLAVALDLEPATLAATAMASLPGVRSRPNELR